MTAHRRALLLLLAATTASCASSQAAEQPGAQAPAVSSPLAPEAEPAEGEEAAEEATAGAETGDVVGSESPAEEAEAGVSAADAAIELAGERFRVVLPDGFREVDAEEEVAHNSLMQSAFRSGGLVLLQRSAEDGAERRGVILARGPTPAVAPYLDEAACQAMAEQMERRSSATQIKAPALVDLPAGRACGFSLTDPDGISIHSLFITKDGKTWGLQALHDANEAATPEALKKLAVSWMIQPEERARGQGFSIPIPTGFVAADEEQAKKAEAAGAALILAVAPPGFSEARRGYIWVQPIEGGPGKWSRLSACEELATSMLAGRPATAQAERIDVVQYAHGQTCRVQIADAADPMGRVITTPITRDGRVYVVTCNLDVRDVTTRAACQKVASELLPAKG